MAEMTAREALERAAEICKVVELEYPDYAPGAWQCRMRIRALAAQLPAEGEANTVSISRDAYEGLCRIVAKHRGTKMERIEPARLIELVRAMLAAAPSRKP